MIHCRTLGPVVLTADGEPAPPDLLWRKNLALLLYLARSPERRRTRDHLIGLLWADKDESAARHSLREAIRVLRRSVGEENVAAEADQVVLGASAVELDTDRFASATARADWQAAADLATGDFCEGFGVPDSAGFEDWLSAERLHWRRLSVDALVRRGEQRLASGDPSSALALARRAGQLAPDSGAVTRLGMKCLALSGDRNGALEAFQLHATRLRVDSGQVPDQETQGLEARVRREREWRIPAYARSPAAAGQPRRGPLVARDAELASLLGHWGSGVAGRSARLLVIEAEPGFGKTRLAEEILTRARLDGAVVAAVRAVPADQELPLGGLLGLARGGLLDSPGVAGAPAPALASLASQSTEWLERFGAAVRNVPPLPFVSAFGEVVRAASEEQPILLVVDDAHWLDDESFAALETLLRDLASRPVGVLLAAAAHPPRALLDGLRARLGRDLQGGAVRLAPLDPGQVEALARASFPEYGTDEIGRLGRRVAADSAGIPFLAVELLSAVQLGLELSGAPGAWPAPRKTLDHTLPGDLPESMIGAIRVGFRRLTREAQQVLCAVAVLGDRVSSAASGRATGLSGAALDAALDELEWQRWLVAEPRGYAFLARISRDVVLRDMVTPGQRQRMLDALGPDARRTT